MDGGAVSLPGDYRDHMRWDALFADLEAEVEEARRLEHEAEVADQARAEYAAVRLTDRVRAHHGQALICRLVDGQRLEGRVLDVGPQWVLLQVARRQVVVPLTAIAGIDGLTHSAAPPEGEVERRIGLAVVFRGLAVRRVPVCLALAGGGQLPGTVDRVGADHLDLAMHAQDAPRRASAVTGVRLVPFTAVMSVTLGTV